MPGEEIIYWGVLYSDHGEFMTDVVSVSSEWHADAKVRAWKARGVNCIKVYRKLSPWTSPKVRKP